MTPPSVETARGRSAWRLFRRRTVWLPTWQGSLLIGLVVAAALLLSAWRAVGFLALREPAPGRDNAGARTLVVEGWLDRPDLDQAAAIVRGGRYALVLTTGGPVSADFDDPARWPSYAERAASYLRATTPAGTRIVAVPAPASAQDRTFLSAVMLREWAKRNGAVLEAIDLVSAGVHARRSRRMFQAALGPEVAVGVLATAPVEYDARRWWTGSTGTKTVLGEAIALAWTVCCFHPPAPGSHAERWGATAPK